MISLGGENRERGSDCEGKKARLVLSVWIAHRKRVLTDEPRFKRFCKMDFCIICIFNPDIIARFFCLTYSRTTKIYEEVIAMLSNWTKMEPIFFVSLSLLI